MSENTIINLNTCRVCLNSKTSGYVELHCGNIWLELYEYCFGITVNESDVPKKLCLTCTDRMKEFADFKRKCYHSDQLWKSVINSDVKIDLGSYKEEYDLSVPLVKQETDSQERNYYDAAAINFKTETELIFTKIDDDFEEPISNNEFDESLVHTSTNNLKIKVGKRKKNQKYKKRKKRAIKQKENTNTESEVIVSHLCGLCDFISSCTEEIKQHLEEHRAKNELNCKLCSYEGRDFADMVTHRYDHYPKDKKVDKYCYICRKRFVYTKLFEFHYRSVHLQKDGGWCIECNKIFRRYISYRNHIRLHDEDTKKFICDHCGKVFLYRNQIEAHWVDISDKKEYVCDTCGRAFKRSTNLMMHISTVHKNVAVKCSHCNQTFKNEYRLKHHLKMASRKKEYVCKVCSKAFYTSRGLKTHEFWHTGERPYPCEICGKSYKNKSQLVVHIKRHRGICEFKCNQCPKAFVTSTQLKVHKAVHTGVRRHKCMYCERSFHGRKLLVAHCATKHKVHNLDFTTNRVEVQ